MHAIDDIADPATCGEDLWFNARETRRLAPQLCPGCADSHIVYTALRPFAPGERIEGDRRQIIAIMRRLIAVALRGSDAPIDILLAGSADTGLLATCAHAVAGLGKEPQARTRYRVLDLCPTPLALCTAFARRHGLSLSTEIADLTDESLRFSADIVLVHSVFRFFPVARRPALLAMMASWLKLNGSVVFSNSLFDAEETVVHARAGASRERLARAIADGSFDPGEPADDFMMRVRRRKSGAGMLDELASMDDARTLFQAAGLVAASVEEIVNVPMIGDQAWPPRRRVLAVLHQPV